MSRIDYVCPIQNNVEEKTAGHYLTYLTARRDKKEEFSEAWWELETQVIELGHDLEFYRSDIKPNMPGVTLVVDNSHDHMYQLRNPEHKAPTLTLVK